MTSPQSVIVGRRYSVPCVRPTPETFHWPSIVPILGPLHEDRDIIGFHHDHWHIDFRFVNPSDWDRWTLDGRDIGRVFGKVINRENSLAQVFTHRLKCYRQMPEFPMEYGIYDKSKVAWIKPLEHEFCKTKLKPGCAVCPHRGVPLVAPADANGVTVCPGHGLAWNLRTGELVRRETMEVPQ